MKISTYLMLLVALGSLGCNHGFDSLSGRSENNQDKTVLTQPDDEEGADIVATTGNEDIVLPMTVGQTLAFDFEKQPAVGARRPQRGPLEPAFRTEETVSCVFKEPLLTSGEVGPFTAEVDLDVVTAPLVYVDGVSNGDGTRARPFSRLADAVASVRSSKEAAVVVVAGGEYREESLTLSAGHAYLGGFDPVTWQRDHEKFPTILQLTEGSLWLVEGNEKQLTRVDGFTLIGAPSNASTIQLLATARLQLSNNTIYTNKQPVTWKTYGDNYFGTAISGLYATLQAAHNRFVIPDDEPENMISVGIRLSHSCQMLINNHFVSYRTAISSDHNTGLVYGNIIEDSYNGIMTHEESITIQNNSIGLQSSTKGCGYAIYLGAWDPREKTTPSLIENVIILQGGSAKGINESYDNGDPKELTGNHFVLLDRLPPQGGSHMLYGDADGPHDSYRVNQIISTIEAVNDLADIPLVGENTVERVGEDDL